MEEKPVINDERASLYDKFKQSQEAVKEAPKETNTETPSEKGETGKPSDKKAEVPPTETGVRDGEGNKPTPSEKMVPHGAFHAEREKRKEYEAKLNEMEAALKEKEEQQKVLLSDLQKLAESKPADQPIDDYEKAILDERKKREALEKEVSALKADHQKRGEWERMEEAKKAEEILKRKLSDTDSELSKEGFPGFSRFKALVAEELQKRVREGELQEAVDTPEEWKRTFKEIVFPQVREMFVKERLEEKEKRKEEANISTGSGGGTSKQESKSKPWTMDDYWKMRQEGLSPR